MPEPATPPPAPVAHTTWCGSTAIVEIPGAKTRFTRDGAQTTLTLAGPYTRCLDERPLKGQTIPPHPGFVTEVEVTREHGGKGLIAVTLLDPTDTDESTPETDTPTPPRYGIRYVVVEKPLEANPYFNDRTKNTHNAEFADKIVFATPAAGYVPAGYALPDEDTATAAKRFATAFNTLFSGSSSEFPVSEVVAILKKADVSTKSFIYTYLANYQAITGQEAPAQQLALIAAFFAKYNRGQESYSYYTPVARRTTQHTKPPENTYAGYVDTLPEEFQFRPRLDADTEYKYLKTTDDLEWTGRHGLIEQTEEWTGATEIDEDLYPATPAATPPAEPDPAP